MAESNQIGEPALLSAAEIEKAYQAFFDNDDLPYCDGAAAVRFIRRVAELSPPGQRATIENQLLPTFERQVQTQAGLHFLHSFAAQTRKARIEQPFADHDEWVMATHLEPWISAVNGDDQRPVVLFVAMMPYFVILREAMYLRQKGYRVFLLSLSPLPENLRPIFEEGFDGLADTRRCLRLMRRVLEAVQVDIVHVQCWMWSYVFGRLAIETKGDAKVFCEFYDVTSLFAERKYLVEKWRPALVDLDIALERYILLNADGVISRFSEGVAAQWFDWQQVKPRYLNLRPYASPRFTCYSDDKLSKKDGVIRLVYLGSLIATDGSHPTGFYPGAMMPSTFHSLLEQGFGIDVFHIPHEEKGADETAFASYYELEKKYEHFRMLPGVPPDQVSENICRHDYGILLYPHDKRFLKLRPLQEKGVISTKVFSYFEAGLPALVIAEHEDMSDVVVENGLGPRVPAKDIRRMKEILETFDYDAAVENVKAFNERYTMEGEVEKLIAFYDGPAE